MASPSSAKSTIESKRDSIWRRLSPRIEALRKMFSRPVYSGTKPAPSSSSPATLRRTMTRPASASRMRAISFSEVLLPAPLGPMIPNTSPGSTSKLTPRSAQWSSHSPKRRWKTTSFRER